MAEINLLKANLKAAEKFVKSERFPGVHAVGIGQKTVAGKQTGELCLVFTVEKKKWDIPSGQMLPQAFAQAGQSAVLTDVIENPIFKIQPTVQEPPQVINPRAKHRPAPGGVSVGHHRITAGTLGGWCRRVQDLGFWVMLSNAHVLANTNDSFQNDAIRQPGPTDGGTSSDRLANLLQRVHIHMGLTAPNGGNGNGKKKVGKLAWKGWLGLANAVAWGVRCQYRAKVLSRAEQIGLAYQREVSRHKSVEIIGIARSGMRQLPEFIIKQPWPNLVDAAIAMPVTQGSVLPTVAEIGQPAGVADAVIGGPVVKFGRTTELRSGTVEQISVTSQVSYGQKGTGYFADQIMVRGTAGDFSAGGDSGSWILDAGDHLVGLLFAGGGGITLGNRALNVFSILGLTL